MKNEFETELHNFVVENVVGTCMTYTEAEHIFSEYVKDLGFPESTDFAELLDKTLHDAEILLCSKCNWWVNQYEISWDHDDVCDDCAPAEED
ncbi:MAG: hypothetical protein [Bacteriophage sp.]|nr:MAG: hypothetical protein [Bacteriophage sp.]